MTRLTNEERFEEIDTSICVAINALDEQPKFDTSAELRLQLAEHYSIIAELLAKGGRRPNAVEPAIRAARSHSNAAMRKLGMEEG